MTVSEHDNKGQESADITSDNIRAGGKSRPLYFLLPPFAARFYRGRSFRFPPASAPLLSQGDPLRKARFCRDERSGDE